MKNYISRHIDETLNKYHHAREAIVLTGFRRVGKTSVMRHIYVSLASSNKIYLDLESPVNQRIFANPNYENIAASFGALGLNIHEKSYIFLDEIQKVHELPSVVKYLYDTYNTKFYLTGSSSFYLKNYFSESLAGRKFVFELFPLTFTEFLRFKGLALTEKAEYDRLSGLYKEYVDYGGFPSVVMENSIEQKLLNLDDILGSYFELDVKNLSDFKDNEKLKHLMFLLSSRVGNKVDVTKISESLQVSRPTVYEYLSFFEQTYLIHFLKPLSGSKDVQVKSIPKVYFNDTGILNRIAQVSTGHVFENKIFNQLYTSSKYRHQGAFLEEHLNYYQTKTGGEIDFIVDKKNAYEVKVNATVSDAKKLHKIAQSLHIENCKVVSLEKIVDNLPGSIVYPFDL